MSLKNEFEQFTLLGSRTFKVNAFVTAGTPE